jgi:hypothetical protein
VVRSMSAEAVVQVGRPAASPPPPPPAAVLALRLQLLFAHKPAPTPHARCRSGP